MTISTTRGTELSVDNIILRAYQLAGIMNVEESATAPQWESKSAFGRALLDTILDELQAQGVYARSVMFLEVPLTAGEFKYSLSPDILDLVEDGMYIDPTNTDLSKATGETPVKQVDRETWQRFSSKAASGRPYNYFVYREPALLEVRLWPIPDEAGTIRFQAQRLMADTFEGDKTVDLRQYWTQFLLWELAHQFAVANSLPVERCSYFSARADEKRNFARAFANQHVNNFAYVEHYTPWRSR